MDNKLNIQITVTDKQMSSLIRGNLENLPDEKIQEIFSNALTEFLKTSDGQKLFYTKTYYSSDPRPTDLLVKMVSNAVSKDLLKPCVDEFIETIKSNYESLIKECMIQTFSNMFFTEMRASNLQVTLNDMLNERLNNQ
jgi:uncharacterized membrane protein YheB (UPF0754 family)